MLGLRHWVATVPEDEDGEAGCRGTALAGGRRRAASLTLAVAVALGVGAVEAALEGPGVGGRRADALEGGPVARAGRRRRRPGPPPPCILGAVTGRFT